MIHKITIMNIIYTYISSYSPLLTLYTNIIILRKSYSPQKGSNHTYLNKEDKRDYYSQINFILVAVILTFEQFLLIIRMLNAHKG